MSAAVGPNGQPKPKLQRWRTPPPLVQVLVADLGIVVDVACTDRNAVLQQRITKRQNALARPWSGFGGAAFYNPPYEAQGLWVSWAAEQALSGVTSVGLPQVAHGSAWFVEHQALAEIHYFDGRVAFVHPRTLKPKRGADFDVCVWIFRPGFAGAGVRRYRSARTFRLLPDHAITRAVLRAHLPRSRRAAA